MVCLASQQSVDHENTSISIYWTQNGEKSHFSHLFWSRLIVKSEHCECGDTSFSNQKSIFFFIFFLQISSTTLNYFHYKTVLRAYFVSSYPIFFFSLSIHILFSFSLSLCRWRFFFRRNNLSVFGTFFILIPFQLRSLSYQVICRHFRMNFARASILMSSSSHPFLYL